MTSGVASIFHVDQPKFPWRQRRNAKHVILGTSSFFLQPKLGQAGMKGGGDVWGPVGFPIAGARHPPLLRRKAAEPGELSTGTVLGSAAGPVAMTPTMGQVVASAPVPHEREEGSASRHGPVGAPQVQASRAPPLLGARRHPEQYDTVGTFGTSKDIILLSTTRAAGNLAAEREINHHHPSPLSAITPFDTKPMYECTTITSPPADRQSHTRCGGGSKAWAPHMQDSSVAAMLYPKEELLPVPPAPHTHCLLPLPVADWQPSCCNYIKCN